MYLDKRTEAAQYLKKASALAAKSGDKKQLALCYMYFGQFNNAINNYVVALDDLMEALRLFRELKDTRGEAATLMNLGITYFTMKDYTAASNYFLQSEKLYIKNNEPEKVDIVTYLNANVFLQKNYPFAAIKIFQGILTSGKKVNDQRKNECLLGIGTAYLKLKLTDSAGIYINAAYVYFDSVANREAKSFSGSKLSVILIPSATFSKCMFTFLLSINV